MDTSRWCFWKKILIQNLYNDYLIFSLYPPLYNWDVGLFWKFCKIWHLKSESKAIKLKKDFFYDFILLILFLWTKCLSCSSSIFTKMIFSLNLDHKRLFPFMMIKQTNSKQETYQESEVFRELKKRTRLKRCALLHLSNFVKSLFSVLMELTKEL